ncbi:50S ribosomal protein L23 [Candidatus Nomurabacteria bacterium]|nr:50S ribosomal protein L23 [Candidatus Nomurabacteria bacterium]
MGIFNKKSKEEVKDAEQKDLAVKEDSAKKVVKKATKKVDRVKNTDDLKVDVIASRILLRPVISEKATMANSENKYIFEVAIKANKVEVKKAIQEVYGIVPQAVNIINQSGKKVHFGRRAGRTKDVKKAIVTLKKGDSITIYEGI